MLPLRIILEGRSYLQLEANLPNLQYDTFPNKINTKLFSDNEGILADGHVKVGTVTKSTKRIDGVRKNIEESEEVTCIRFKWNTDSLETDPDLLNRYYNYFADESDELANKFMPFINDGSFSGQVNKIVPLTEAVGDDLPADDLAGMPLPGDESAEDALPPVDDTLPPVDDNLPPVDDTLPPVDDTLPPVEDSVPTDDFNDMDGFTDEPEPEFDASATVMAEPKPEYFFYVLFKYEDEYDSNAIAKTFNFFDSTNTKIQKIVVPQVADSEEDGISDDAFTITGTLLAKKAEGFFRELIGILNANYEKIVNANVEPEVSDVAPIDPILPDNEGAVTDMSFDDTIVDNTLPEDAPVEAPPVA